jgi:hypothetical protein
MLAVDDLTKRYGSTLAVDGLRRGGVPELIAAVMSHEILRAVSRKDMQALRVGVLTGGWQRE